MKFLAGLLILLSLLSPKCLAGTAPNLNNAKVAHVVGEINGMTEFSFEMEMREY